MLFIFLFSGIVSFYFYCNNPNERGIILPGLIYTSSTILVFILSGLDLKKSNILLYYLLMMVTYLAIFFLTWMSTFFAAFVGIITAGLGACISLWLVKKFVSDLSFDGITAAIFGALGFVCTDICGLVSERQSAYYFFKVEDEVDVVFAEIFFFWQFFVGSFLVICIKRQLKSITIVRGT